MNVTITRLVSICMARRCDDTIDKKGLNFYVLKKIIWRKFSNQKSRQKPPGMLFPTRY